MQHCVLALVGLLETPELGYDLKSLELGDDAGASSSSSCGT